MAKYISKRLVSMIVTLLIITTVTFFLMHAIPGGPFSSERQLPPEIEKAMLEKYNLDQPVYKQFFEYLSGVVRLDFGPSFSKRGLQVIDVIKSTFPNSLKIGGVASVVVIILGIPMGVMSALKRGKFLDYLISVIATLGVTIPSFVLGTSIMFIFGEILGVIPVGGLSNWKSYIGPVIATSGFSLAFTARLTRSSMLEVLGQDYIRTAKASGIAPYKVTFKYALKNALIPTLTYLGPSIASILTGSFVIEKIFNIPGLGLSFVDSITNRDYTMIMSITLIYSGLYIIMVFLVDIAYALLDPRIKLD